MKLTTIRILLLTLLLGLIISDSLHSQKGKVTTAYNYLLEQNFSEAQKYIDEASTHEQTSKQAKTWYYKGIIYEGIYLTHDSTKYQEFKDLAFTAVNAYKKALTFDTKKINKEDLEKRYLRMADFIFQDGVKYYIDQDYLNAALHFQSCEEIKLHSGIIDSLAIYNQALSYDNAQQFEKAISNYERCIAINYYALNSYGGIAFIYGRMSNDELAMQTLEKGRLAFPDDQFLLTTEINYLLKYEMLDKAINNLNLVIEGGNKSPVMYYTRGTIYNGKNMLKEAETDYLIALSLNPDYFDVLYNLGVLYFNSGADIINTANDLTDNAEYQKQVLVADTVFTKAIPYLEKAHLIQPDNKATMQSLLQLYGRTDQTEKYEAMKVKLDN